MSKSIPQDNVGLVIDKLSVQIQNKFLLSDVSATINLGETVSIIGPNGAGKTTLLRAIGGDIKPASGTITFDGIERSLWPRRQLACQLASLPQQSRLNFPFTVHEVVSLSRLPHHSGVAKDKQYVNEAMERMDVQDLAARWYTQLSGGEKQRVQIARVLAQLYPIDSALSKTLLLDEPCAGLDLKHQAFLAESLKEFSSAGVKILLSAHDLNWAIGLSDKLLCLKNGTLMALGTVEEIIREPLLQQLFEVNMHIHQTSAEKSLKVYAE